MVPEKKILLIIPYGSVGGMERLALNFYDYYKSKGYPVKVLKLICLKNDIINFKLDELFVSKKDLSEMSKKDRLLFYLKIPFLIRANIKKHNITHSIAFGDMANLFSSLSYSKEYKIGSVHALKSVEFQNKTLFHTLTKYGYQSSYKYLNKLVCISTAIKTDLIENCKYKFDNTEVIYNPHDIDAITNLSQEPLNSLTEIKIFEKPCIVFLGRLSYQKAPWHFIKSFYLAHKQQPEINLVIIGDGDENVTNYINSLISKLGLSTNVFLLGRKSNPYKYLAKSKVLVLSSYYEGTPNVIVESIILDIPIVSSNCTLGISELMSLTTHPEKKENTVVEAGIITPNFYKDSLKIPKDETFIHEEKLMAEALGDVLVNNKYKDNLIKHKKVLLKKFNLKNVSDSYLKSS